MKNVALASLILASFSLNALAVPAEHNQPLLGEKVQPAHTQPVMPVAADGAERVGKPRVAEGGADRLLARRLA